MKITKFEQSGFIIENKNGYKLAIDIAAYTPVEKLEGVNVDAMIVSHIHGDHFNVEQIKKLSPKKLYLNHECIEVLGEEELSSEIIQIKTGDIVDVDGITVECFDVDHGPNVTVRPLENFGFLINVDGEKVYFAGDMFYSSGLDVSNLEVDYALIPVGGYYTFGPQEAFDFVKKFQNIKNVVPMHYEKTNNTKDEFMSLASGGNFKVLSI